MQHFTTALEVAGALAVITGLALVHPGWAVAAVGVMCIAISILLTRSAEADQ